jgi:hypothetical protein
MSIPAPEIICKHGCQDCAEMPDRGDLGVFAKEHTEGELMQIPSERYGFRSERTGLTEDGDVHLHKGDLTVPPDLASAFLASAEAAASGEFYVVTVLDPGGRAHPEQAIAFLHDGRVGISWGGETSWGRVDDSLDHALDDWLNDERAWERRQ